MWNHRRKEEQTSNWDTQRLQVTKGLLSLYIWLCFHMEIFKDWNLHKAVIQRTRKMLNDDDLEKAVRKRLRELRLIITAFLCGCSACALLTIWQQWKCKLRRSHQLQLQVEEYFIFYYLKGYDHMVECKRQAVQGPCLVTRSLLDQILRGSLQ